MENEKKIKGNSGPIEAEKLMEIIDFSQRCMCKISFNKNNKTYFGSGFFCKLSINELGFNNKPFLMTNNHVIDLNYLQSNNEIALEINKIKKILNIKDRYKFTNILNDFTIIEIIDSDNIDDFFEVFPNVMSFNSERNFDDYDIIIPQFPLGNKLSISSGTIKRIDYNIIHTASTEHGSSGSPILSPDNLKLIGIHKQSYKDLNENIGSFIKNILLSIKIGGNFNISKLKLIKTIQNNYYLKELILLNDGRPCTIDILDNVKVYDSDNFTPKISIQKANKIEDEDSLSIEKFPILCCNEENKIIFKEKHTINIVDIDNLDEYQIIQKIENNWIKYIFSIDNYIIGTNYDEPQPPNECVYVYKKNLEKYSLVNRNVFECSYDSFYFEKLYFKDWEIYFWNSSARTMFGLDIKKIKKKKFIKFDPDEINGYFYRNQMVTFGPSYIIIGNEEILLDLKKLKEIKDEKEEEFFSSGISSLSLKTNAIIEEKDFYNNMRQQSCYQNLNEKSFIYLNFSSHLKQFNVKASKSDFEIQLFKEREDINGQFFIKKDDLLFVLKGKDLLIYQFSNC